MFTITDKAKEILTMALQKEEAGEESAIRIQRSTEDPQRLEFELDQETEGDTIITNNEGLKLMLIQPDLAEHLNELMLDFQQTPQGPGFVLMKIEAEE